MPVNIVDGIRWNAAFAFLDPVRDAPHLRIAGRTTVRQLAVRNGAVTGVQVTAADGRAHTIHAGRVVLAAGAYHSPALLLRSGIGPAGELRALGIRPVTDLPGVGRHLLDHPCAALHFAGRDGLAAELAADPANPDEQTVGRARSARCDAGPYDIHVFMVAGANSGHPGLPPISLYGGAMRARSEGRVTLAAGRRHRAGHRPPVPQRPRRPRPRGPDRGARTAARHHGRQQAGRDPGLTRPTPPPIRWPRRPATVTPPEPASLARPAIPPPSSTQPALSTASITSI